MADQKKHIEYDDLLREDRTFSPPAEFTARAHVRDQTIYAEAERDPEAFWARFAGELEWSRPCRLGCASDQGAGGGGETTPGGAGLSRAVG